MERAHDGAAGMPGPGPRYSREFVEAGYNNRAAVPDYPQWFARWAEVSAAVRAERRPAMDLRFGPGPKETLDLFLPRGRARGTFLFLHGGWWRGLDKSDHSFVAPAFVDAGYAVAVANYDLCPAVRIDDIVDEARRAVAWVAREGAARGAEPSRVVVGGHSAGGHLTAMMFATDWQAAGFATPPLHAGVSLSGVHDLRPLTLFSGNADWGLDDAAARRLSPVLMAPRVTAPLLVAVGAEETSEFRRQSAMMWDAWPAARPRGTDMYLSIPARHHFDVVFDYTDAASALTRATLALFDPSPG
jgi:arylformamidase